MAKKTSKIDAVRLVRSIRDRHAADLAGKSDAEILTFYRKASAAQRRGQRKSVRRSRGSIAGA